MVTVQRPLAGIEPPITVIWEPRMLTFKLGQVVVGDPDTIKPSVNSSNKGALKLASLGFGLLRVIIRLLFPGAWLIVDGIKALPTTGGRANAVVIGSATCIIAVARRKKGNPKDCLIDPYVVCLFFIDIPLKCKKKISL
jgi:hypothetical protein